VRPLPVFSAWPSSPFWASVLVWVLASLSAAEALAPGRVRALPKEVVAVTRHLTVAVVMEQQAPVRVEQPAWEPVFSALLPA